MSTDESIRLKLDINSGHGKDGLIGALKSFTKNLEAGHYYRGEDSTCGACTGSGIDEEWEFTKPEAKLELPEHHVRYARAWAMHQDKGVSDEARRMLEKEMDSAQNHFEWDEFQAFKKTLPGFVRFWDDWQKSVALKAGLPGAS